MTSYTNEDFDSLYKTVRRELIQKANYDIMKDDKYKTMLSDVVMSVREKKKGTSQYINSLVLNSIVPKFTTMINKGKNANAYNPPVNSPVDTLSLPRPDFTRGQNYTIPEQNKPIQTGANIQQQQQNFEDQFSKMCNQSSRDDNQLSAMERFEEMKRDRGVAIASDEFNKSKQIADQKTLDALQNKSISKIENNNEFFKNLYENKIGENSPFKTENPPEEKVTINRSLVHEPIKSNQKQDPSTANKILENEDKDIEDLKDLNNLPKQYEQFKQDSTELYRNTSFTNPRENGKMIILDSGSLEENAVINFKATLIEPIIIDRIADVFIEFITIQNLRLSGETHLETVNLFALNIEELPTQIGTTNADFLDKYIFPNETFGTSDIGGEGVNTNDATTYTLKLKSNYYTNINANKFTEFNVKLQGLVVNTLQNIESAGTGGRITIGLFIKKR
jgi:hypothetical protein